MDTSLIDIGEAPTRRRPYFLEQPGPASSPSVTCTGDLQHPAHRPLQRPTGERPLHSIRILDMREFGPRREAGTLLRALMLFALLLALVIVSAIATAIATSSSLAVLCFCAMLSASASALLAAEVLAEEIEFLLVTQTALLIRARFWWERMRRRLRELAGGTTALSFGPYR